MSTFGIYFGAVNFTVKDFMEKSLLDFLKKLLEMGDQPTTISDLQSNEERVSFRPGNTKII